MEFTKYEDYKNIWREGYAIERDGQKIELTGKEIREIYDLLMAANGQGSIEYYLDSFDQSDFENDPEMLEKAKMADKLLNNPTVCKDVWDNYLDAISYDTGDIEWETVDDYVMLQLRQGC